jgi:hypothetical protein
MSTNSSRAGKLDAGGMLPEVLETSGPPGPIPPIAFNGIEVVQVVQDIGHTVTLVANKSTLVRVYLSTSASADISVRGTLAARRAGAGAWTQIPSTGNVVLNPTDTGAAGLRRKRETLALSLNFLLPASLLSAGDVEISLSQIEQTSPVVSLPVPPGASRQVTFHPAATLRVQVIGIRYQTKLPGGALKSHEPSAIDYALIRSWLGRAYPVARVEWSQTVVDWHGQKPWPANNAALGVWGKDEVNPYVSSLRTQDVASGTDHRTHYYGLAADSGGFMRGWAANIPSAPDPSVVASGPAGPVGFAWDTDGSYADWYTGHELAHTFGRFHPGFCSGNSHDDPNFPFPNGQIAHDDGDFVGYDDGDTAHAIPPQALPGTIWHDLMTYCDHQWLSRYTYEGIYQRLIAEEGLAPGAGPQPLAFNAAAEGGLMSSQAGGIHVVARINQTEDTGEFRFVTPVASIANAEQSPAASSDYTIRVRREDETTVDYPAAFRRDVGGDESDPNSSITGSLDVIIPNDVSPVSLELIHNDYVLATYSPQAEPSTPEDIRAEASTGGPFAMLESALPSARPKIVWTSAGSGGPAFTELETGSDLKYTVQVSTDGGESWRTIGVGLVTPEVTIDPQLLAGKDMIQVRVTATNGFKRKTATQTLDVENL